MADRVAVGLLGPVKVSIGERVVPVRGVKLQSVVALLALAAPRPVSDERLVDELWGDDPPAKPTNALQALISHLRKLLGRDTVVRQGSGYVLHLSPDGLDAARLEQSVGRGRAAADEGDHREAAACFRDAISVTRGPPLVELADGWFARETTARLSELVLAAHEGLAEAELALGRHAEVLDLLQQLVTQHPLRERFQAQLVLALYRSGRQADALRVARAARQHLRDELGLEPGPELQELELAVLAHDPALRAPVPLTPSATARTTLPQPLTSFVGRKSELTALGRERGRLVTLVGPAGVGKTRLAIEWARDWAETVAVHYVELAAIDRRMVGAAIGRELRAFEVDGAAATIADPVRRAIDRLRGSEAVLVLDNCEHVAGAVATCARTLLEGCLRLRIVATSREPLGVDGERLVVVDPLDLDAASQLFVERARAVQPLFQDDHELSELCSHLDGLPLAIELAAARTRTLPVAEITARLHDRFRLLRSSQRSVDPRHAGLEAAIDWSYELLFEDERRTFRRLAMFSGGATSDAIDAVCGADGFEVATRLVHRSLFTADTSGTEVRFGMLESLRDYGIARLVDADEREDVGARHFRWYLSLAERANAAVRRAEQLRWLERLDREHENLRVALEHGVTHDPWSALRLVGALFLPWWLRGRRQELVHWFDTCLAAAPDAPPALRAPVHAALAYLAEPAAEKRWRGELEDVLTTAEHHEREALQLLESSDDPIARAGVQLLLMATITRRAAAGLATDRDELVTMAASAREVFTHAGDHYGAAGVCVTQAVDALIAGDVESARQFTHEALRAATHSGERYLTSRVDYLQGVLAELDGEDQTAYRHFEHALRSLDELGMHDAVTAQARLLEPLAQRLGEHDLAAQWRSFIDSRTGDWSYFDGTVAAASQNRDGLAALASGDLQRAAAAHVSALRWYVDADLPAGIAFSETCLGFLAAGRDDRPAAAGHLERALSAATSSCDGASLALALEGIAITADRPEVTATLLGAARRRWAETGGSRPAALDDVVQHAAAQARRILSDTQYDDAAAAGAVFDLARVRHVAKQAVARGRSGRSTQPNRSGVEPQATT